jgi:hypothetical protein
MAGFLPTREVKLSLDIIWICKFPNLRQFQRRSLGHIRILRVKSALFLLRGSPHFAVLNLC